MKPLLSLLALVSLTFYSEAQVLCIRCYDQNARILSYTNNMVANGGFENTNCVANAHHSSCFCPNSVYYNCSIPSWTCTGGGSSTYACVIDPNCSWGQVAEGNLAVYFGSFYCRACSGNYADTSCVNTFGCETTGIPAGYPISDADYGLDSGLILSQTVSGLTAGSIYFLEFWTGGESIGPGNGMFALDIGFGNMFLRDPETYSLSPTGRRYVIVFAATSSSHTIRFTNWGHICNSCSELILDDVGMMRGIEGNTFCTTSIDEHLQNKVIDFFPNPVSSNSEITITHQGKSALLIINNTDGREVMRYPLQQGISTEKLTLPKLAAGVYVARMVGEGVEGNAKFIIE